MDREFAPGLFELANGSGSRRAVWMTVEGCAREATELDRGWDGGEKFEREEGGAAGRNIPRSFL